MILSAIMRKGSKRPGEIMRILLLFLGVAAPIAAQNFIGNNACKTCHPDVWQNFYKNPHYKSIASGKESPDRTGCEGCHGPGGPHVEAGGGKTTIGRSFNLMSSRQVMDACLTCHAKDLSKTNIRRSEHTMNGVVCTNCHSIHHSPEQKFLLAKKQNEMCYTCHATVQAQFSMPSKHRVNEGFMQCSDCHDPHGTFEATWRMSERPHMVKQANNNEEACVKCHVEKRGPFVFEHAPVRTEGCETCHSPHGSMNAKLLRRPVVFTICLECHNGAASFGTRNNGVPTQTSQHNMLDPKYQKCTTCHMMIHGSNSDPYFKR